MYIYFFELFSSFYPVVKRAGFVQRGFHYNKKYIHSFLFKWVERVQNHKCAVSQNFGAKNKMGTVICMRAKKERMTA